MNTEQKYKMSNKLKYLYDNLNNYSNLDRVFVVSADRPQRCIEYSINKKKRWEEEQWDRPIVGVSWMKGPRIAIDLTGKKVVPPLPKEVRNTEESDVFYFNKRYAPKPDFIFNSMNYTGTHCLRRTTNVNTKEKRKKC